MKRLAVVSLGVLLVMSMVILVAAVWPDEQREPRSQRTPTHRPSATATVADPIGVESPASHRVEVAPPLAVEVMKPHVRPVIDVDYDDSWIANVPDVIGGYRVLYITTPKSVACSRKPVILLQAPQESMDEFLSAPLDVNSLRAAIRSVPGVPSSFYLSFSRGPFDREEVEARIRDRNEFTAGRGCHHSVDPDGPATSQ